MVYHYHRFIEQRLQDAHLVHLCNQAQKAGQTTAIFTRSGSETRRISRLLETLKIGAIPLHCDLSLSARAAALDKLRRKECHAIVTTDIAAASLGGDPVPKVDRIINLSLTWKMTPPKYGQRISNVLDDDSGSGQVITFFTQYDVEFYMRLEYYLAVRLAEYAVDDMDVVMSYQEKVEEAILEDPSLRAPNYLWGGSRQLIRLWENNQWLD
ncbi:hypothetical protein QBC40DRAFT_333455 [Triangularia verruculosa]|uniref:Helicase C-terminal domain-containing protein n=1 Tax=Triangularia verruculosa TaxID=2587418 RepID=A0AAN6XB15_9PEZI|nr:hypothetical protein QBC40DRAFT_333455 [Triangularia verruculosa]